MTGVSVPKLPLNKCVGGVGPPERPTQAGESPGTAAEHLAELRSSLGLSKAQSADTPDTITRQRRFTYLANDCNTATGPPPGSTHKVRILVRLDDSEHSFSLLNQQFPVPHTVKPPTASMGIIKRTIYTTALTGTALIGYVAGTTSVICPLPRDDPIWSSKTFSRYNIHKNPTTQDVVIKRIPLDKIRPELLQKEGDLAVEFCRGVWAGWGKLYASSQFVFGVVLYVVQDERSSILTICHSSIPLPTPLPCPKIRSHLLRQPLVSQCPRYFHIRARHQDYRSLRGCRKDAHLHHRAMRRLPQKPSREEQ